MRMEFYCEKSGIRVTKAGLMDLCFLEKKLRMEHVAEIRASHGLSPQKGILLSYLASDPDCYAIWRKGELLSVFGVAPNPTHDPREARSGTIWLLSTDAVTKCRKSFALTTRRCLLVLLSRYEMLENHADARFEESIAWLKWLGAEVHSPASYGVENLPFHYFRFRRGE